MRVLDSMQHRPEQGTREISEIVNTIQQEYLSHVVSNLSFPRHFIHEHENNLRAGAWVANEFRLHGYNVEKQGRFGNIVATHPQCRSGPSILVGSHYDTVPGSPGADDNASAVAVSLACAKVIADRSETAPVVFVCFNREEDNLLGSTEFVEECVSNGTFSLRVAHILEMVGYCRYAPNSQHLPQGLPIKVPNTGDFLAIIANRKSNRMIKPLLQQAISYCKKLHVIGLQVYFGLEQHFPHLLRSDHAPFWSAGIPALMWTDTSEFRNANYHLPSDIPDTLNFEFMKRVAQLLMTSILSYKT